MTKLTYPFSEKDIRALRAGDAVSITGRIYTGRDKFHKYFAEGGKLPVDFAGGALYHCGPVIVQKDGAWHVVAAGPTTSVRENPYEPAFIEKTGVRIIIGKGGMDERTLAAMRKCGCVYVQAVGGAAAISAAAVKKVSGVSFLKEFGAAEAVWHFDVEDFRGVVAMDARGKSLFAEVAEASKRQCAKLLARAVAGVMLATTAFGGVNGVVLKTGNDRPISPLKVDMPQVGRLAARGANEVGKSNWTIGCEVLDRDFANFWEYCEFIEPLGIKTVRLQSGWAKCERKPGEFNFAWLDQIVDYLQAHGLEPILETSYGNPIYEGAGGWDLSGGIPNTEEGLRHWDVWVETLARHFAGRVKLWAMWNEPDNKRKINTPEKVAAFNLRTARTIRRVIPDARLQGLSLGGNDVPYFEGCLKELAKENAVDIFETYIYHGYELAPEISYPKVEAKKLALAKYSTKARLRQGENGCPSELLATFALANTPWTEYSQAKWDMRRMLGDLGHGYESSVYTMSDFRHHGVSIHSPNNKGLIRVNDRRETIAVKRAYYAVQNVAGLFDAQAKLVGCAGGSAVATNSDITIAFYHYEKTDKAGAKHPLFVFWTCGHTTGKWRDRTVTYDRPGDSFETRPTVIDWKGAAFRDPVWVDLLTGRIYALPPERMLVHSCGVTFVDIPVYDSPVVLTERAALEE